ncbi:MAG TPA: GNAT family N-acetyltransferase [Pseudonocardiaceae bacterium]
MRTSVREYEERDEDGVVGLSLRAWAPVFESLRAALGGLFDLMYTDWRVDQEKAVRAACRDEGLRVWVAEVDGAVAGFAAARVDPGERMGEVHMIAVDPGQQRRGVGTALMAAAMAWFRESGMTLAMVETGGDPGHAPARALYEHAGYTLLPVARYFSRV